MGEKMAASMYLWRQPSSHSTMTLIAEKGHCNRVITPLDGKKRDLMRLHEWKHSLHAPRISCKKELSLPLMPLLPEILTLMVYSLKIICRPRKVTTQSFHLTARNLGGLLMIPDCQIQIGSEMSWATSVILGKIAHCRWKLIQFELWMTCSSKIWILFRQEKMQYL